MDHSSDRNLTVTRYTKGKIPRLPFVDMKDAILGSSYELSIAFVSPGEIQKLNRVYRKKDYPTNVLAFPLSDTSGELVLNLSVIRTQAPKHSKRYDEFLHLLVIHGMLHLKGYEHGSTMEEQEQIYMHRFYYTNR